MSKEVNVAADADPELVTMLASLPDPGAGKRLIVYVRGSSVRLRRVDDPDTLEEQDGKAGGAGE